MNLSLEEKLELEKLVKQTKDKNEYTRLCVVLSKSEGISAGQIAQTLRITLDRVYTYLKEYEDSDKTKNDQRGGSQSKLNEKQAQELRDHLQRVTYLRSKDICQYVKNKYKIKYSISGMVFWLKENEFEYKKPVKVPGKMDVEKQTVFIEEYEELKSKMTSDEEIYFLDAVHPEFQSQAVCGWIKKGETKTLPTTNKQYRLHFIGAVALEKMKIIAKDYEAIDGQSVIDFLQILEASSRASTLHVICDNARANKNKALKEYLKNSRIQLHYLPPYSPNLNPIERLWKLMREHKTYNKYYDSFKQFTEAIHKFFYKDIAKMKAVLRQRVNDHFQCIQLNSIRLAST